MKNGHELEHEDQSGLGAFHLAGETESEARAFRQDAEASAEESEHVIMDEDDAVRNADREAARKYMDLMKGIFASIYDFEGPRMFALDCAVYVLQLGPEILGMDDMQKIAVKWKCTRQNVQKLVERIRLENKLPLIEGQRSSDGRTNMSISRIAQLDPNTP